MTALDSIDLKIDAIKNNDIPRTKKYIEEFKKEPHGAHLYYTGCLETYQEFLVYLERIKEKY